MFCTIDLYIAFTIHVNLSHTFVIILFGPNLRVLYEMFVNIWKLCHLSFGNFRGLLSSEWFECGVWNNQTW